MMSDGAKISRNPRPGGCRPSAQIPPVVKVLPEVGGGAGVTRPRLLPCECEKNHTALREISADGGLMSEVSAFGGGSDGSFGRINWGQMYSRAWLVPVIEDRPSATPPAPALAAGRLAYA